MSIGLGHGHPCDCRAAVLRGAVNRITPLTQSVGVLVRVLPVSYTHLTLPTN